MTHPTPEPARDSSLAEPVRLHPWRRAAAVMVLVTLQGCGAASPSAPSAQARSEPPAPPPSETLPTGPRDSEAEENVGPGGSVPGQGLGEQPPATIATPTGAPAPGPVPGRPEPKSTRSALPTTPEEAVELIEEYERVMRRPESDGSSVGSAGSDRCQETCSTLELCRRAVDRLCQLTTSSDARCVSERKKLEELEKLGADAGCRCG